MERNRLLPIAMQFCLFSVCIVILSCTTLAPAEEASTTLQIVGIQPSNSMLDDELTLAGCTDVCCGDCCEGCQSKHCDKCCEAICCPKRVTEEVKKHCWKVNPQLVCIPGFRLPWERCSASCPKCGDCCGADCKCCQPKCGKVRCVNVLEKHEYTCEQCGCEWEVKCVGGKRGCDRKTNCRCPNCDCAAAKSPRGTVDLATAEQPTAAAEAEALSPTATVWNRLFRRK